MRDGFKLGDEVLFYHSNTEVPAIMGVAEVCREGYEDSFALDPKSKYFDEDAKKKGKNPWVMVDIRATRKFKAPVTRPELQKNTRLKKMLVLAKGSRLSVQPVQPEEFKAVLEMATVVAV